MSQKRAQRIKLTVNGKEVEGILVENVRKKIRSKVVKGKTYTWEQYDVYIYLPKDFVGKKLALIPIPE